MTVCIMTARPGHKSERTEHGQSMLIGITERPYGQKKVDIKDLDVLRAEIKAFGTAMIELTGGASFHISVRVEHGSRKPRGFDTANTNNGLGEEAFMRCVATVDHDDLGLLKTAKGAVAAAA